MTEAECDKSALLGRAHAADKRLDHARSGTPCDMEARHRIAVAGRKVSATLRPADNRENAQALLAQPGAFLTGGEIHIGLGPTTRPVVFGAIEPGGTKPILQRKIAERPERLAAERGLRFLIEDDDAPARIGEFAGCHKASEAGSDNDRVRVQVASSAVAVGC